MLAATRDLLELTTLLVDLPPGMKAAPDFAELRRVHGWALASHGLQAPAREALMAAAQLCLSQGRRTDRRGQRLGSVLKEKNLCGRPGSGS